jgi:hypothetical protein
MDKGNAAIGLTARKPRAPRSEKIFNHPPSPRAYGAAGRWTRMDTDSKYADNLNRRKRREQREEELTTDSAKSS